MTNFEHRLAAQIIDQQKQKLEQESSTKKSAEQQLRLQKQAVILGTEVVRTLISYQIPRHPVWVNKKIAEQPHNRTSLRLSKQGGIDHIFEYKKLEDGWKILQTTAYDEGYYINDKVAIGESGILLEYSSEETYPNGILQKGPKVTGIVRPNLINPERAIELLSSDLITEAVATLINTGRVYSIEGNLHLGMHSQSLSDNAQTRI